MALNFGRNFMKTIGTVKITKKLAAAAACLALGWLCWCGQGLAVAQNPPANLSPALLDVVKLAQAHMPDDIIIAQIKNSGATYSLSADDILYLNSQGVSANVISTLQQMKPAAPPPPVYPAPVPAPMPATPAPAPMQAMPPPDAYVPPVAPPGSEINLVYFQSQLGPYGNWVDVPPYGPVWRPNDAMVNPGWRPYFNSGFWQYTEAGWFWHSETPYGDIVFHYGRWLSDIRYGWVWVPGYDWAPAWVAWRNAEGYAGWAPLPPGARFEVGVGLMYRGALAVDVDFGLRPDDYIFVGYDHFWDHDYRPFLLPRERFDFVFRASLVRNGYGFHEGRFVIEGLGRDRIELVTHRPIIEERIMIRDARIEHGREIERSHAIEREREIRSRPPNDPLRRNLETRDAGKPADVHKPEEVRKPEETRKPAEAAPARGGPAGRDTKATPARSGPAGRDTQSSAKDPKEKDTKATPAPGGKSDH